MSNLKKTLQTLGSIAVIGGLVAATTLPAVAQGANPCAPKAKKAANPCGPKAKASNPCAANPCKAKAANPCAGKNPCAAKRR